MKILGIDLGGCFSANSAYVLLEKNGEGFRLFKKPFMEPRHKSFYDCKNFLKEQVLKHSPDIVSIDSPFSIPKILCDKDYKPLNREGESEISNPYLYRFTDYFIYKNFGIKPMPPAGDRIGRVTARCMELLREFNYDNDNIFVSGKKVKIYEVFPRQIGELLVGKKYKKRDREVLKIFGLENEKILEKEHIFDALLAAYGAFEIEKGNTIYPLNDKIKEEGWIYPVTKCSFRR